MKGDPKVLAELNLALSEELTAINQYFLHAELCESWGYGKLAAFIKKQSIDEMKHAEVLIERILFLDSIPCLQPSTLNIGNNVKAMLEADLSLESQAISLYNNAAAVATELKDNGTREIFLKLLKAEEEHTDWLEAQLHQIQEMGYGQYLSSQTS